MATFTQFGGFYVHIGDFGAAHLLVYLVRRFGLLLDIIPVHVLRVESDRLKVR